MKTSFSTNDAAILGRMLVKNVDLFAWTLSGIPRVSPEVITNRLFVYKEAWPVVQRKRKMGEEKWSATKVETGKLLNAGFICNA